MAALAADRLCVGDAAARALKLQGTQLCGWSFFMSSFLSILSFFIFLDFLSFFMSSFLISSFFISSFLDWSCIWSCCGSEANAGNAVARTQNAAIVISSFFIGNPLKSGVCSAHQCAKAPVHP